MSNTVHTPKPRRTGPIVAAALIGVAALFAVAFVLTRNSSDPAADPEGNTVVQETSEISATGNPLAPFGENTDPDAAVGVGAPSVSGQDFFGQSEAIVPGTKPLVVAFVAHWCSHCQREVPKLADWVQGGVRNDVDVRVVATSTQEDLPNYPPSAWLEREGLDAPTLADDAAGSAAKAYGVTSFPFFVAIDAKGIVAARTSGELSEAQFDELIAAAKTAR